MIWTILQLAALAIWAIGAFWWVRIGAYAYQCINWPLLVAVGHKGTVWRWFAFTWFLTLPMDRLGNNKYKYRYQMSALWYTFQHGRLPDQVQRSVEANREHWNMVHSDWPSGEPEFSQFVRKLDLLKAEIEALA